MNTLDDVRAAAIRAYSSLRFRGHSDCRAFEAAVGLFRVRCPRVDRREAHFVVATWICDALEPEVGD
ncbi:MAG: hypothetical protein IPK66_13920 [Rhodospirillales bacterium]|nr:hypothetical protein [Rhodospirillales bacterium]